LAYAAPAVGLWARIAADSGNLFSTQPEMR